MIVGIDDIAMYVPRLYVDATDFADHRNLDPAKPSERTGNLPDGDPSIRTRIPHAWPPTPASS